MAFLAGGGYKKLLSEYGKTGSSAFLEIHISFGS